MMKLISIIVVALCVGGCVAFVAGGAAGAGAVTYLAGELKATVENNITTVWQATESAARDLELDVSSASADKTTGRLEASNAAGQDILLVI